MRRRRPGPGDHREQHLLARHQRARDLRRASAALPRNALVQPARVDAGRRGDPAASGPRPRSPSGSSACSLDRQAPERRRAQRRLHRQPPADGAVLRGGAVRRGGPRLAARHRRGRPQLLRLPPALLRPVPDRRHGGPRRLRGGRRAAPAGRSATASRSPRCCASWSARAGSAPPRAPASTTTSRARPSSCSSSATAATPRSAACCASEPPLEFEGGTCPDVVDASVLVVGGGAVGGVTAGLMAGTACDASSCSTPTRSTPADARPRARVRRARRAADRSPRRRASSPSELEGPFDFALVTLEGRRRSSRAAAAARGAPSVRRARQRPRARPCRPAVGDERADRGDGRAGATNVGPGRLRQTTRNPFVIGELDGTRRPRTSGSRRCSAPPAGRARHHQHPRPDLVEAARQQRLLGARCRLRRPLPRRRGRAGRPSRDRRGMERGPRGRDRPGTRARARPRHRPHQITFDPAAPLTPATESAIDVVVGHAGATEASMLQDLKRGVVTEVDVINGAVVARARARGLDAPRNARIVELVHASSAASSRRRRRFSPSSRWGEDDDGIVRSASRSYSANCGRRSACSR